MYIASSLFKVLSLSNLDSSGFGFPSNKEKWLFNHPTGLNFLAEKRGRCGFSLDFPYPFIH